MNKNISDGLPLVSVIIPVYDVEPFIHDCLDSVLRQTYDRLEIIVVDDGSPDSCPDICDGYARRDRRISVIHRTNGGLSEARNSGLDVASGAFIMFVDSDDAIHERTVEHLMAPLVADPGGMLSCCEAREFWFSAGYVPPALDGSAAFERFGYLELMEKKHCTTAWGKIYRADLFSRLRFPAGRYYEDLFTVYKLIYKARAVHYIDLKLYYYRKRSGSITTSLSDQKYLDVCEAYLERIRFFAQTREPALLANSIEKFRRCIASIVSAGGLSLSRDALIKGRLIYGQILPLVTLKSGVLDWRYTRLFVSFLWTGIRMRTVSAFHAEHGAHTKATHSVFDDFRQN